MILLRKRNKISNPRALLVMLVALLIGFPACRFNGFNVGDPTPTATPELSLDVEGQERTYELFVPEGNRPDNGWPLVIVLHGLGADASEVRATSGFDAVAAREGFVVAYPNGLARAWIDAGLVGRVSDTDMATDNLEFIAALIRNLDDELSVDDRRVFVSGISNGGMFAFHAACHLSDRIAAVGLVAAASISQSYDSCAPDGPVAYIAFHGTSDTVVPYSGGQIVPGFANLGEFQSAEDAARFWATVNRCGTIPERVELPDIIAGDNSIAYRDAWDDCETGRQVQLVTLDRAGHAWPGHPPGGQRLGDANLDIDATEMLWDFFAISPKPDSP